MKLSLVVCSIIAVAAVVGCSSSSNGLPDNGSWLTSCVPNQTIRCLCGLDEGMQTCTSDGELTACVCKKPAKAKPAPSTSSAPPPDPGPPPPACGDGKLDAGEACDDGNLVDGDGCSSRCKPDGAPDTADACPGQPAQLWQGSTLTLAGTTEGFKDDLEASCFPSTGPDRVYAVQPSADGFMTVDAVFAPGFDAIVEIREDDCASKAAQVLCQDTLGMPFQNVVRVSANKVYRVIVDGDSPTSQGAFTIKLDLP